MSSLFSIDERLRNESHMIHSLKLSDLLLKNCREFPWIILVPSKPFITEVFELAPEDQHLLMDEICSLSTILKTEFKADKINIASFGNVVSQLHVHIIARYHTDSAWPNNPWTCQQLTPYSHQEADAFIQRIKRFL